MYYVRGVLLSVALLSASFLNSQTAPQNPASEATFHANVRVVLVDVVVTTGAGDPVVGLPKEDFQIFEDGQPQTIASFEEHAGLPDLPALSRRAQLPPNSFSNLPLVKTGDAANVLLLDSLNTPLPDQSFVHEEMLKYMKEIQPGTRLAIFTLGEQLRFVQGFTSDASVLAAALHGKKAGGNPSLSPLLMAGADLDVNQVMLEEMQGVPGTAAAAAGLQQFLHQNVSFENDVRARTTLEALQQLARYLGGFPGRKNVIWFASNFPISLLNAVTQKDVIETANLLTAAQVAVYPIGAQGLAPDPHYDFTNQQPPHLIPGQSVEQAHIQYQNQDLQRGQIQRARTFTYMDLLADQTGGQALYNQNGLDESIAQVLKEGTHYYTLTYSPTNRDMDGRLRKVEVKVSGGKYHLAYRRGYYATAAMLSSTPQPPPTGDPLRPLMDHGAPDATEILYTLHLAQSTPPPGSPRAGDNANLQGPLTRYTVNFAISIDRLVFDFGTDGARHGNLEATVVGYDRDGKPQNWMARILQIDISPDRYAAAQANGIPVSLQIDVPASALYLRSGIYDMGSSRAGTLEIPLNAVVAQK
jgi:VWFA-related protein